jgi:hypothetical protein
VLYSIQIKGICLYLKIVFTSTVLRCGRDRKEIYMEADKGVKRTTKKKRSERNSDKVWAGRQLPSRLDDRCRVDSVGSG